MDLEIFMLGAVSETEGEISDDIRYMQNLKRKDTNEHYVQMNVHTAAFNVKHQQGPAVQSRELCSVLCDNLMVTRGKDEGKG